MRLFLSTFGFILTMLIGVFAFAYTAVEYPSVMRQFISYGDAVKNNLTNSGIPDNYMVWADILLGGDNLVLLGFIIVARIIYSIILSLISPFSSADRPSARLNEGGSRSQPSPFDRWGRSAS